jgi:hypothetical protein
MFDGNCIIFEMSFFSKIYVQMSKLKEITKEGKIQNLVKTQELFA